MVPLKEDSVFYGLAAEIAEMCQAFSRSSSPATDVILRHIMDASDQQIPRAEDTTPDPIPSSGETCPALVAA
jgi:hypothetical protein